MEERPTKPSVVSGSLSDYGYSRAVPPPPAGPSLTSRQRSFDPPPVQSESAPPDDETEETPPKPARVFPFDAELEIAEIDSGKAGPPWAARARTLSTSSLTLSSRRMTYVDRRVVVAVHRVDDNPVVLHGRVADCRYESDGLYTIDLELLAADEAGPKQNFSRKAV